MDGFNGVTEYPAVKRERFRRNRRTVAAEGPHGGGTVHTQAARSSDAPCRVGGGALPQTTVFHLDARDVHVAHQMAFSTGSLEDRGRQGR